MHWKSKSQMTRRPVQGLLSWLGQEILGPDGDVGCECGLEIVIRSTTFAAITVHAAG